MHTEPRREPIEKGVVHVNVGPEVPGGAAGLASYLNSISGGYHNVYDNRQRLVVASDDQVVWGASFMNARGKHYCLVGEANQTRGQWLDSYSSGEMDLLIQDLAVDCKKYGWQPRRLTEQEVRTDGVKGLCGHIDVTNGYKEIAARQGVTLDHWDPGPFFPWDVVEKGVQAVMIGGAKPPAPQEVEEVKFQFEINDPPDGNPFQGCEVDIVAQKVATFGNAGFVPAPGEYMGKWRGAVQGKDYPNGTAHIIIFNTKGEKFDFSLKKAGT